MKQSRRQFCQIVGYAGAAALTSSTSQAYCRQAPKTPFGKTGLYVSRIGLCASRLHLAGSANEAGYTVRYLLDCGVNYIDTSPNYGAGFSESILGSILRSQRDAIVLATKTRAWSKESALEELEKSLERLQTDYVDVWMLDNPPIQQIDNISSEEGALTAALQAKQAGKCRFIGISGQSHPDWLLAYSKRFTFDVIQMPLNAVDPHYLSFEEHALPQFHLKDTAIVGNKTCALGTLRNHPVIQYEDAIQYALSLPVSVTMLSCAAKQDAITDIREAFTPRSFTLDDKCRIAAQCQHLSSRDVEWYKAIV